MTKLFFLLSPKNILGSYRLLGDMEYLKDTNIEVE
jgi:hypothetical protein